MKVQPVSTIEFDATAPFAITWTLSLLSKSEGDKWPKIRTSGGSNVVAMSSIVLPNNVGNRDFVRGGVEKFQLQFQAYQHSRWQNLALNALDVYAQGNAIVDNKQEQFVVAQYLERPVVFPANMLIRLFPINSS